MQHDEQSGPAGVMTMRNIEFVVSTSGSAGVGATQELSTVRDLGGLAQPDPRQSTKTEAWKLGLTERRGDVTRRPRRGLDFELCSFRREIDKAMVDGSVLNDLLVRGLLTGPVLGPTTERLE